ncbi:MAG: restriction endonuclease [Candidatus Brocadiales bacterium]|nr:restriction endonuclease [Candidatus Brocadiales bacterium]
MTIPDYQTVMLPLLEHLGDKEEKATRETLDALASRFNLTEEEKKELLPSGQQPIFSNRVGWAKVYLKKAGLIESARRGYYNITPKGLNTLSEKPSTIDNEYLKQFSAFLDFTKGRSGKGEEQKDIELNGITNQKTPEEYLEYGYQKIHKDLSQDILDRIKGCSPAFFERLVIELLLKMGYGGSRKEAGQTIGRSGDEGIDGIIKEDRLGLDVIYIQAKRWEGTVGRPDIQKFAGALQGQRAKKGIFITTSNFSKEAQEYASLIENKIVLINGEELSTYMIDLDIGVSKVASYEIKRVDSDYFTEE